MSELGTHDGDGYRFRMYLSAPNGGVAQMLRDPDGDWVPYSKYIEQVGASFWKQEAYELKAENARLKAEIVHDLNQIGGLQQENARLKADVEKLTLIQIEALNERNKAEAEVERLTAMENENANLHKGIYSLSLNVVQLKDEVERLRKAGDAMVFCINLNSPSSGNAIANWEAAKEGKPSV